MKEKCLDKCEEKNEFDNSNSDRIAYYRNEYERLRNKQDTNIAYDDVMINNGFETVKMDGKLLKAWVDFNKKVFSYKKIVSVCIEDSEVMFHSLGWILGFEIGERTIFSDTIERADLLIVSLEKIEQLVENNDVLAEIKCLVTIGNTKVDFEKYTTQLGDIQWINYYAFPQCACVSFAKSISLFGKTDIYHQLKPIAGTSISIVDENNVSLPKNVLGYIVQNIEDVKITSNLLGTITTEKKIFAENYGNDVIYLKGKYFNAHFIYKLLLRSGKVNDVAVSNDTVYYSQKFTFNEIEIQAVLREYMGEYVKKLSFIEVPYIPKTMDGKADLEGLEKLTSRVHSKMLEIRNLLENEYEGNTYVTLDYENKAKSIISDSRNGNANERIDEVLVSDEQALISKGPIDYQKYEYKNIADVLVRRKDSSQKILYINEEGESEQEYQELYQESLKIAIGLKKEGIKSGDFVVFQIIDNREYITAFWGCMLIGAVVAPLGVLDNYLEQNLNREKLHNIINLLEHSYVLASDDIFEDINSLFTETRVLKYGKLDVTSQETFEIYDWASEEVCLMLFTSGSTGVPKGVGITSKNIFARTIGEIEMYHLDSSVSDFNWMTLTHAAGIIWSHIRDVFLNAFQIQADTNVILKNPLLLLDYMSKYQSTTTWAPNFAYALVADAIDENIEYDWDLSHATNVYSGGETNVSKVLRRFLRKAEKYNFPKNGLIPAFGMTETSSCMTYYNGFNLKTSSDEDRFIPIGTPSVSHSVRITDENGNTVKKGQVGKIEYKGDAITPSYYKNEEANREAFTEDGYFITGDLGYIVDDNVVLTGRMKEMIIINGLNYYVQDIEAVVDEMDEVATSYTVAVSVKNNSGIEEILIVFTPALEITSQENIRSLTGRIRDRLLEKTGLYAKYIVPEMRNKSIRTEIGKKQRSKYRQNFYEGKYDDVLQKTGVLKDTPYIMEEKWTCEELLESSIEMEAYLIDTYMIDQIALDHESFIEGLLERGKAWADTKSGTRILVPTLMGIAANGDEHLHVNAALVQGFVNSFNQENPDKFCIQIDFDEYNDDLIQKELHNNNNRSEVVYRKGKRFVREFRTILSERKTSDTEIFLQDRKVLVVGGLGGVGVAICQHLVSKYNCSLLILGRSSGDDKKIDTIRKNALEEKQVVYSVCDATDQNQIEKSIVKYEKLTGNKIDVMINLAGSMSCADGSSFWDNIDAHKIENEEKETFKGIINAKLLTTIALEEVACRHSVKEFILFGSVNGIQGGFGLSAYAASSGFQHQFANYINAGGKMNAYCINWSGWYGVGMSREIPEMIISVSQKSGFRFANVDENIQYFDVIIRNKLKSVIVGIDRENPKNKVVTNDIYHPIIDVYYSGYDSQITELVEDIREGVTVNYLKVDHISSQSGIKNDVNICDLKRSVLSVSNSGAELTESEKKMAQVWKRVLHLSHINPDDNFFELGGNSLLLTKLAYEIEDKIGVNVPISDILINGSLRKLVKHMEAGNDSNLKQEYEKSRKRLEDDIQIDFDIDNKLRGAQLHESGNEILVTIKNDVVCTYVLAGLLKKFNDKKIYCIVNEGNDAGAKMTVRSSLKMYDFEAESKNENLVIYAGNTTLSKLGLSNERYEFLCREVGMVYHFATNLNMVQSYEVLRPENIVGTNRILEFCCDYSKKTLVFMSSLSVFKTTMAEYVAECDETSRWTNLRDMEVGFCFSIYAADEIVHLAIDKGLDCRIMRSARVSCDSKTGRMTLDDSLWQLFKFIFAYKKVPSLPFMVEMFTPMDLLAEQIIGLSVAESDRKYKVYHMKGISVRFDDFVEWIKTIEPDIVVEDYDQWLKSLRDIAVQTGNGLMMQMQGLFHKYNSLNVKETTIHDEITKECMRENGIANVSNADKDRILNMTYDYLNKVHFFDI